jgi:hypothetical protein
MEGTSGREGNVGTRVDAIPAEHDVPEHFGWCYHAPWLPIQHVFWYYSNIHTLSFPIISSCWLFILDDMLLIYDICRYQKAWYLEQISPWCAAFTSENLKVLRKQNVIDETKRYSIFAIQGSRIRRRFGNVSQTRLRSRTQLPSSMSLSRRLGNTNQVHTSRSIEINEGILIMFTFVMTQSFQS